MDDYGARLGALHGLAQQAKPGAMSGAVNATAEDAMMKPVNAGAEVPDAAVLSGVSPYVIRRLLIEMATKLADGSQDHHTLHAAARAIDELASKERSTKCALLRAEDAIREHQKRLDFIRFALNARE